MVSFYLFHHSRYVKNHTIFAFCVLKKMTNILLALSSVVCRDQRFHKKHNKERFFWKFRNSFLQQKAFLPFFTHFPITDCQLQVAFLISWIQQNCLLKKLDSKFESFQSYVEFSADKHSLKKGRIEL